MKQKFCSNILFYIHFYKNWIRHNIIYYILTQIKIEFNLTGSII